MYVYKNFCYIDNVSDFLSVGVSLVKFVKFYQVKYNPLNMELLIFFCVCFFYVSMINRKLHPHPLY